jgi:hypothetical protein
MGRKKCSRCGEEKSLESGFHRLATSRDGRQSACRECQSIARKKRYWSDPDAARSATAKHRADRKARDPEGVRRAQRDANLRRNYGIDLERYEEMHAEQDGLCAVCRHPEESGRNLAVDHCHASGRVRALLCGKCNAALGLLREDRWNAIALMVYIEEECHA